MSTNIWPVGDEKRGFFLTDNLGPVKTERREEEGGGEGEKYTAK